jgi:hypothetical protein
MEILISVLMGILIGLCNIPVMFMIADIFASPKINGRNKINSYIKYIKTLRFIYRSNFIASYYLKNPNSIDDKFFFIEHNGLSKIVITNKYNMHVTVQDIDIYNEKTEVYILGTNTVCPFKKHFLKKVYLRLRKQDTEEIYNLNEAEIKLSGILKSERRNFKLKQILK